MPPSSYDRVRGASSAPARGLTPLAENLRRRDPDRYLTALFAPPAQRETLFLLYAFDHELGRARAMTREPVVALMRLAWWREVVEGAARAHEVAAPLGEALAAGLLKREDLLGAIEAREIEAEPEIPTLADWRAYLLGSAGGIAVAAGRLLGAPEPERLRPGGAAWGAASVLRGVAAAARQGRCLLPADVLAAHGLTPEAVASAPDAAALHPVRVALATEARSWLAAGRGVRLPRAAVAAALPSVLARRDLARLGAPALEGRGLGDRLAVLRAGVLGRA